MNAKVELLQKLGAALTRGQGGFTEEDLFLAFEEVYDMLIRSQLVTLVIEEGVGISIRDGVVFYAAANGNEEPKPMPLETLIENIRSAEGS